MIEGRGDRGPIVALTIIGASIALLAVSILTDARAAEVAPLVAFISITLVAYRTLLRWPNLVAIMIVLILFVPIKRYYLPAGLPFDLEPYRLAVAAVVVAWFTSMLIDPRVRFRKTGFEAPVVAIIVTILLSDVTNLSHVGSLSSNVVKSLTFFASFFAMMYLIASLIRTQRAVEFLIKLMTASGGLIALFGIIERRTYYNVFNHFGGIIPLLRFEGSGADFRSGRLRVLGPAQHPIALGALFALLIPLAIYLAQSTGKRRWWGVAALLLLGVFATASRTAIVMLVVEAIVFIWLRPKQARRAWPLVIPVVLLIHFLLPGAIGNIKGAFFPAGGLAAQQSNVEVNDELASGRIADLGPSFAELAANPLTGRGFGTRIAGFDATFTNARILDDQWLGLLLEVGILGIIPWIWLFLRVVRRMLPWAKEDDGPRGWLMVCLIAAVIAFFVSMFTYDVFSFIQMPFMLFMLFGIAGAALALQPQLERGPLRSLRPVPIEG